MSCRSSKRSPHVLIDRSVPLFVGAVAFAFATTALADPVWDKVGEAFGKAGTEMPGGVYRVALPRTDIKATLDGVELKPGFALGGWLAFQKMQDTAMVMVDLRAHPDEVKSGDGEAARRRH